MANRTTLKGYFNTGDTPTEAQFAELIDSIPNLDEDVIIYPVTSAPSASLGKNNDYAVDFAAKEYYVKSGGSWSTAVSFEGPQGPVGATGPQGEVGPAGPQGPAGQAGTGVTWRGVWDSGTAYVANDGVSHLGSSYIANASSTNSTPGVGAEWDLWVSKGDQGDTGPAGAQGPQGDAGATGPQGPAGNDGSDGATGPQGPSGADGATGPAGPGVPTGGSAGQVLEKIDGTDYNTQWSTKVAVDGAGFVSGQPVFFTWNGTELSAIQTLHVDATAGDVGNINLSNPTTNHYGDTSPHTIGTVTIDSASCVENGGAEIRIQSASKPTFSMSSNGTIVEINDIASAWDGTNVNLVYLTVKKTGSGADLTIHVHYLGVEQ